MTDILLLILVSGVVLLAVSIDLSVAIAWVLRRRRPTRWRTRSKHSPRIAWQIYAHSSKRETKHECEPL